MMRKAPNSRKQKRGSQWFETKTFGQKRNSQVHEYGNYNQGSPLIKKQISSVKRSHSNKGKSNKTSDNISSKLIDGSIFTKNLNEKSATTQLMAKLKKNLLGQHRDMILKLKMKKESIL